MNPWRWNSSSGIVHLGVVYLDDLQPANQSPCLTTVGLMWAKFHVGIHLNALPSPRIIIHPFIFQLCLKIAGRNFMLFSPCSRRAMAKFRTNGCCENIADDHGSLLFRF
jgi:hypothetical protein